MNLIASTNNLLTLGLCIVAIGALTGILRLFAPRWRLRGLTTDAGLHAPTMTVQFASPVEAPIPERRKEIRRSVVERPIEILGLAGDEVLLGRILDRSSRGMRLLTPRTARVGTAVWLRLPTGTPGADWAYGTVRWSIQIGGRCEIGCEFEESVLARLFQSN